MEDQKPGPELVCNLGFAKEKGLELKAKKISKIVQVGRRGEQTSLIQMYNRRVWGPPLGDFWEFFGEEK